MNKFFPIKWRVWARFLWILSAALCVEFDRAYAVSACDESCLDASECTDPSCSVCTGTCVGCGALGDSASCGDTATGASTQCFWMGAGGCVDVAGVPELPLWVRDLCVCLLAGLALYFGRRKSLVRLAE